MCPAISRAHLRLKTGAVSNNFSANRLCCCQMIIHYIAIARQCLVVEQHSAVTTAINLMNIKN